MDNDGRVLAGYINAVKRSGAHKTVGDACDTLGWSVDRYMRALADGMRLGIIEG